MKRQVVQMGLLITLQKSCLHLTEQSFSAQVQTLKAAKYPQRLISLVFPQLHIVTNDRTKLYLMRDEGSDGRRRVALILYMPHKDHNLKKYR